MSFVELMDAFNSGDEVICYKTMKARDFMEFNPKESLKKGELATKVAMDKLLPFEKFISSMEQAPFSGGSKFKNGDTLLARITPCLENGKTAFVDGLKEGEVAFGSTEFIVLRGRKGVSDPQFIYYLAISSFFRNIAIKSMVGSSGRQRVQIGALEDIDIKVPSLEEQRRIASRLALLDSKIALNSRINDNLFAQAKLLFDNEIANVSSIPSEWKKGTLLDIATYTNGLAMQRFRPADDEIGIPVLKIKELRQGFCDSASELCSTHINEEYLISDGDVIFSWSGSLLIDLWGGDICGLNQHLFKLTSSEYPKWFYYLWTLHHLDRFITIAADKATTMGHIKRGDLAQAEVIIPSNDDINRIGAAISPIVNLIIANKVESRKMAALRDKMLIKLITNAQNQS